jgi:transcriptional regulator with XRE-family HTH domain
MKARRTRAAWAFGRVLRAARRDKKLSQEDLAYDAGFDRTYPSLLERGLRTPTFLVILELAAALDMDAVKLFSAAVSKYRESEDGRIVVNRATVERSP